VRYRVEIVPEVPPPIIEPALSLSSTKVVLPVEVPVVGLSVVGGVVLVFPLSPEPVVGVAL
jgi:hypothetical protein